MDEGQGLKEGRKLRNIVKGNLGFWETRDQVNAAKVWAKKEYVDSKRIGIWGWVSLPDHDLTLLRYLILRATEDSCLPKSSKPTRGSILLLWP